MSKVFPDCGHPEEIGAQPWFYIRNGKFYTDFGHPQGIGSRPWFFIQGTEVYPAFGHPEGSGRGLGLAYRAINCSPVSDTQKA